MLLRTIRCHTKVYIKIKSPSPVRISYTHVTFQFTCLKQCPHYNTKDMFNRQYYKIYIYVSYRQLYNRPAIIHHLTVVSCEHPNTQQGWEGVLWTTPKLSSISSCGSRNFHASPHTQVELLIANMLLYRHRRLFHMHIGRYYRYFRRHTLLTSFIPGPLPISLNLSYLSTENLVIKGLTWQTGYTLPFFPALFTYSQNILSFSLIYLYLPFPHISSATLFA